MTRKVLIIEDDAALRESIRQMLELEDLEPIPTASLVQARRSIRSNFDGVILSDIRMPDQDGFDVLHHAQTRDPELPVILITGHSDVPTAIRAVREGAYDYLEKPFETSVMINTVLRALKHRSLILGNRDMSRQLERGDMAAQNFPGEGIVSKSLRDALRNAAANENPVHLYGEEGSGKRTAAFVIHALSQSDRVFETLNCQRSTAQDLKQIDFKRPTTLSVKNTHLASPDFRDALRSVMVDAPQTRLITTSLSPATEPVYPASSMPPMVTHVPSLYERREDIHDIFAASLRQTARASGVDVPLLAGEIPTFFKNKPIPQNFMELRQLVKAAFDEKEPASHKTLPEKLEIYEASVISEALKMTNGRVAEAAQKLGVPRNTLYDRMSKLGLVAKDYR